MNEIKDTPPSSIAWDKMGNFGPLFEQAARGAERCEDDGLAAFYAEKGVEVRKKSLGQWEPFLVRP